jgi:hypothetical protein
VLSAALVTLAVLGATGATPIFVRELDSSPAVTRLVDAARAKVRAPGPYLVEQHALTVGSGVLWGLARRGYDLRVSKKSAPLDAVYLAESHGPDGAKLDQLFIVNDLSPYSGTRLGRVVASTTVPNTAEQRRAYRSAIAGACRVLERKPPEITPTGQRFLARHARDPDARALARYARADDACGLVEYRLLQRLIDRKAIRLDAQQRAELAVYAASEQLNQPQRYTIYVRES